MTGALFIVDGLTGVEEAACGSDPLRADTDLDRLSDAEECHIHFSDPTNSDSDGDGQSDFDEVFGTPATDPNDADNDKDGEVGVYNQSYGPDCNDRDPLVNSAAVDQWPNGTDLNCAPDAAPNASSCPCGAPCSCYANSWSCTNVHRKGYTVTLTITESYHDAVNGFVPWTYSVTAGGGEQNGECREQVAGMTGDYACSTWVDDQGTLGVNYSGFEVVYEPPFRYRLRSVGKENNNSGPYWRLIESIADLRGTGTGMLHDHVALRRCVHGRRRQQGRVQRRGRSARHQASESLSAAVTPVRLPTGGAACRIECRAG